jgi:hypothetical protein
MQHEICSMISFAITYCFYSNWKYTKWQTLHGMYISILVLSYPVYLICVWLGSEVEKRAFWWITDLLCTALSTMCFFKNWPQKIIRGLNCHLFSLKPSSAEFSSFRHWICEISQGEVQIHTYTWWECGICVH